MVRCLIAGAFIGILGSSVIPASSADEKTDALLKEVSAATKSVRTLTADLTMFENFEGKDVRSVGTVRLKRPNLALLTVKGGPMGQTISSDGKALITLMSNNQYMKSPADPAGKNIMIGWAFPVAMFFDLQSWISRSGKSTAKYLGKQAVSGHEFEVIEKADGEQVYRFYVNDKKLITRSTIDIKQEGKSFKVGAELTHVKVNAPISAADLAFQLPKTAKLFEQPNYEAKLIPVGKLAEKFDLIELRGDHITLDDAAHNKKAVLVNFWFYG